MWRSFSCDCMGLLAEESPKVIHCSKSKLLPTVIQSHGLKPFRNSSIFTMQSAMICDFYHSLNLTKCFLSLAAKTLWKCGEYNSSCMFWRCPGWVWEFLGRYLTWIFGWVRQEILWIRGLVSTRRNMNAGLLDMSCSFQTSLYWQICYINTLWCFS